MTRDNKNFEESIKDSGLIARILGGQPTVLQKVFFWLMVMSLLIWSLFFFGSLFLFDAPIRSTIDEICRYGIFFTILLYPIYLFPLMRFCLWASRRLKASWLFFLCPLIPIVVISFFFKMDSSEFAAEKPEGYDPSTFVRLNEAYSKDVKHVYYHNEILDLADPSSFRVLSENHSADKRHVWYNNDTIPSADPTTFVVPESKNGLSFSLALAHDAHDYYHGTSPLHVADVSSFKKIDGSWAIDCKNVYYLGLDASIGENNIPIGDYATFRALSFRYAKDSKCVYYENQIVEGADPKSFRVLDGEQHFAQDKNRVYYQASGSSIRDLKSLKHKNMDMGLNDAFHTDGKTVYNSELMAMPAGCDFATIHRIERYRDWYADKNRVYYENRLLPGANPLTFRIFQSHYVSENHVSNNNKDDDYSCDVDHVYYQDSLITGVDIASFICGYDYVDSCPFAFDKNRYYQGSPNPRLEKLRQGKCHVDSE